MLDKSVPYVDMLMRRPKGAPEGRREPRLPEGYSLRLYRPGDRGRWAAIEASVGEFPDEEKAAAYFDRVFLPEEELLKERMWFVEAPDGRCVATTTAWHTGGAREGMLHWVACRPDCQGLGLGRAVVTRALRTLEEEEPGAFESLHTQTWSHPAVGLYLKLGFRLRIEAEAEDGKSGFEAVKRALRGRMRPDAYEALVETAYRPGEMSALEAVCNAFAEDKFATHTTGIAVESAGEGRARCGMVLTGAHCNAMHAVMGGAIFTLADFAFAVASNCEGMGTVSIGADIRFLGQARGKRLYAEAEPVKVGRSICVYRVDVLDELGTAVAVMTATGFRKG